VNSALHHRSRVALRTGRLEDAQRDNARARAIACEIGDRLEIGELWLEDGDRASLQGAAEEARRSWSAAATDPPDRDDCAERAGARLEELAALEGEESAARLADGASERIARGDYAAAESVARWAHLAPNRVPDALARAAASLLRARGGGLRRARDSQDHHRETLEKAWPVSNSSGVHRAYAIRWRTTGVLIGTF